MINEAASGERCRALTAELDERRRRLWAAPETRASGRDRIGAPARATGLTENTIRREMRELEEGRVRRPWMPVRISLAVIVALFRPHANRWSVRARALSASSSRFRGGALIVSEVRSSVAAAATSSTARSKAAAFAREGRVVPLSFRTN